MTGRGYGPETYWGLGHIRRPSEESGRTSGAGAAHRRRRVWHLKRIRRAPAALALIKPLGSPRRILR